jgi:hypothetical protein
LPANSNLDPLKLVFVDETAAAVNMVRRYGRRRRGQRLRCGVPGHYKAITLVCGLRLRGVVAPKAYDGAMNAEIFEIWLEEPSLADFGRGLHRRARQSQRPQKPESGRDTGQKALLGQIFAAVQPRLQSDREGIRQAEVCPAKARRRTVAGLVAVLESCADLFNPHECENYLKPADMTQHERTPI